jgi:hypothetical protein
MHGLLGKLVQHLFVFSSIGFIQVIGWILIFLGFVE